MDLPIGGDPIFMGTSIAATRATIRRTTHSASSDLLYYLVELLVIVVVQFHFRVHYSCPTLASRTLLRNLDHHHSSTHPSTNTITILRHWDIRAIHRVIRHLPGARNPIAI